MTVTAIESLIRDLKGERGNKEAEAVHKVLVEIVNLDRERLANLPKIRRQLDGLERQFSSQQMPYTKQLREWMSAYRTELSHAEVEARRHFGNDLAKAVEKLGITLTGQYPVLQAGLYTVKMRSEQDKVELWYGREQEKLGETRLLADEVAKRIEQSVRALGSQLEVDAFFPKLLAAFRRAPRDTDEPRRVPIVAVLAEMAFLLQSAAFYMEPTRENYRSYSRADFSYDLFRCQRDERFRLVVATRMHTTRRTDYLWVPTDPSGRGTLYSHIIIEDVTP